MTLSKGENFYIKIERMVTYSTNISEYTIYIHHKICKTI